MLKDITIGQYYPAESRIHALDPRVKLFATFLYIISLFLFQNVAGFVVITISLAIVIRLSNVPLSFMVRGLRSIVILLLFAATINLLLTPGIPIFSFGFIRITQVGLKNAVLMTIRMIYLIVGSQIMTLTTTPNALTDGLEKSLSPLKHIGVPVHEIAMMMSIALRFVPILIEETDKIMKAQMARGADFESGGLIHRMKAMIPLLVPLFVSAFRRASDLALAMEARCYHGGEGRTKMKPLHYHANDVRAYAVAIVYLAAVIATNWL
ncbi:MAG: energy-coupling factor transporter transmembrane protein EcfT [Lachnospiraceae bacterium]|nr:energy-coupling factor transporter transmembrane protein EcfT [Lachnospiraceae bacterium]